MWSKFFYRFGFVGILATIASDLFLYIPLIKAKASGNPSQKALYGDALLRDKQYRRAIVSFLAQHIGS
ncbi:hypothetical protein L1987_37124 [Smallanthus sonchifolius]|uniref:Uncharacterized protein n=1 Tax=Smallanthus sonchifolius TaxID=185202 RepID=A0ACB9HFY0_9ASTR|nr:hypothetical protein L1987_37124 [Smallanthus sonchifolius]